MFHVSSPRCTKQRLIFVHIPKTGGCSIQDMLGNIEPGGAEFSVLLTKSGIDGIIGPSYVEGLRMLERFPLYNTTGVGQNVASLLSIRARARSVAVPGMPKIGWGVGIEDPSVSKKSILEAHCAMTADMHWTAEDVMMRIGRTAWDKYASFAVVRNPYDRMVSEYTWRKHVIALFDHNLFAPMDRGTSFTDFVLAVKKKGEGAPGLLPDHMWPQIDFLRTGMDEMIVKTILRFEELEQSVVAFLESKERIGPFSLPKHNTSKRSADYRSYYTEETKKAVEDMYAEDIAAFGYSF